MVWALERYDQKINFPYGKNCIYFTRRFFLSPLQNILASQQVFQEFGRRYAELDFDATLFFVDAFLKMLKKQLQNIIAFLLIGIYTCFVSKHHMSLFKQPSSVFTGTRVYVVSNITAPVCGVPAIITQNFNKQVILIISLPFRNVFIYVLFSYPQ